MGTDHDKVGVPFGRFLQEFVIDPARPRRGALALGRQIDADENRVERLLARFACSTSKSTGTYSMKVAGMTGWTLTSLTSPPPAFASSTACVSPFGVGAGSARSTARTMRLYMTILPRRRRRRSDPSRRLKVRRSLLSGKSGEANSLRPGRAASRAGRPVAAPGGRIVIVPSPMDRYKAAKFRAEIGIANERRVR